VYVARLDEPVRLLTFTTLFPNSAQPFHGLFVERRLQRIIATGEAQARVVAPVPWFPWRNNVFGAYAKFARVPAAESADGLSVTHPRYAVIPKVGMSVAPALMTCCVEGHVRSIARRFDFDLVDAHYFYPDGVAAAHIARKLRRPLVITARGSDLNVLAEFSAPRRQIVRAAQHCAAIITVSDALKRKLLELGVSESKITVLRNGVDLEAFRPLSAEPRTGPAFLSVGNLVEGKGHEIVLRGLAELPGARLRIAGDGPLRHELRTLARELGMTDRVTFLGQLWHESLEQHDNAVDASILVSAREGMPNVVLESLACGTPVIASRVGGIPEVLTNSTAGRMLDEASPECVRAAVVGLLAHPPQKAAVREFAERFAWEPVIRDQLALYRRVIAENPR